MRKRDCYKLEVIYAKWVPILVSILVTINNFWKIDSPELSTLDYLFLPSLITIINFYILRVVVSLCRFHRVFIDYLLYNWVIRVMHYNIPYIPVKVFEAFCIIGLIIFGVILICYYVEDNPQITIKNSRKNR